MLLGIAHLLRKNIGESMKTKRILFASTVFLMLFAVPVRADVVETEANGFQLKDRFEVQLDSARAFTAFVDDFNKWWDASHSYSGKAENLSIDIKERCFLERLPDRGFVRHLELIYFQPGKAIRFSGGLGPLQQMGVCGALTIKFTESDDKTIIEMEYNVSGRLEQGLDKFAPAVDKVLAGQMQRFADWCKAETKTPPSESNSLEKQSGRQDEASCRCQFYVKIKTNRRQ